MGPLVGWLGPRSRLVSAASEEARRIGVRYQVLGCTRPLDGTADVIHTGDPDSAMFAARLERPYPPEATGPFGLLRLPRARLHVPSCMHAVAGRLVRESFLSEAFTSNPKYWLLCEIARLSPARRLPPGVLVPLTWHHNFYHWLVEMVPRLQMLDGLPRGLPLYVPRRVKPFVRESLAALRLLDRVTWLDDAVFEVEELVVPSRLSLAVYPTGTAVDWLRSALRPPSSDASPRRLYISRGDASIRFVTNEDELAAALGTLGFEFVTMAGRTLTEQIALVASARVVVAPHGAALAHLAFLQQRGGVVELLQQGHGEACYHRLSRLCDAAYGCVVGARSGLGFAVEPARLLPVVERVLCEVERSHLG